MHKNLTVSLTKMLPSSYDPSLAAGYVSVNDLKFSGFMSVYEIKGAEIHGFYIHLSIQNSNGTAKKTNIQTGTALTLILKSRL